MFGIEPSEYLLVAIVALVVIGPKDLPRVMRVVGQWVGKARGMARHFRAGFDEMARQAEMEEMEKRWAAENARIMREHPAPPPEEADDAHYATALNSGPDASTEPDTTTDETRHEAIAAAEDQPMLPLATPTAAGEIAAAAGPTPAKPEPEDRP